jgi:hypothetical protein
LSRPERRGPAARGDRRPSGLCTSSVKKQPERHRARSETGDHMSTQRLDVTATERSATDTITIDNQESSEQRSCCGPAQQASCCEPSAKASCCGPSTGGGCGCR